MSTVTKGEHWDGRGRLANFATVERDVFLDIEESLPIEELRRAVPTHDWHHQSSGQSLAPDVALDTWEIWRDHVRDLGYSYPAPSGSSRTGGQGRLLNAEFRKLIEDAAQNRLEDHFRSLGWHVEDVRTTQSYDALAIKGDEVRYLEAKGTQGPGSSVLVTENEVQLARTHPGKCVMGVLSRVRISQDGTLDESEAEFRVFDWFPEDEDLVPTQYSWRTPDSSGVVSD